MADRQFSTMEEQILALGGNGETDVRLTQAQLYRHFNATNDDSKKQQIASAINTLSKVSGQMCERVGALGAKEPKYAC
jgi:hypothetical protein